MNIFYPSHKNKMFSQVDRPLDIHFNIATVAMANRLLKGREFHRTDDSTKCDTFSKIKAYYLKHGVPLIWTGASDNTIYACNETNIYARAFHDMVHILNDFKFTEQGERDTYLEQYNLLKYHYGKQADKWKLILEAEIVGQVSYREKHGDWVKNQFDFVKAFVVDSVTAVNSFIDTIA